MKFKLLLSGVGLLLATSAIVGQQPSEDLIVEPVQGNVYVIAGAGGNIVVQIGNQGVLMVDTGLAPHSGKVSSAIRRLSAKPLQYIVNTSTQDDHTGGNEFFGRAGVTITGGPISGELSDSSEGAQIVAQINVLNRMSAPTGKQAARPVRAWPTSTYVDGQKDMFFNGESIVVSHQPHAHSDGDSLVYFRRSDVIVAGDVFLSTSYPEIDIDKGGSIQGEIDALNNILDIAIPEHDEEGGTYIVPGHGRICDEFDVLEYRDMVTIIRDRIQAAIKKGMTLDRIKTAGLTKDYDARYSAKTGAGTADHFVESVYRSLTKK